MHLAKKNGRISRQIPGQGVRTANVSMGERRGDLYLSVGSIAGDQAYWDQMDAEAHQTMVHETMAGRARKQMTEQRNQRMREGLKSFQAVAKHDPMNEKLKRHFARQSGMGATSDAVMRTVLPPDPADFSSSGANPQYVNGLMMTGGHQWEADFRQHLIVGNPMTRDGVYGPAVTDYDRYVQGLDVNDTDIVQGAQNSMLSPEDHGLSSDESNVAGGTMLGRYNGKVAPQGEGRKHLARRRHGPNMGFDFSWDGITDALSDVVDQTSDNLVDSLPKTLQAQITAAVGGGGHATTNPATGVVTITRPVTGAVNSISQSLGVPPWAIYTGVGLIGVGVLLVVIKALK